MLKQAIQECLPGLMIACILFAVLLIPQRSGNKDE